MLRRMFIQIPLSMFINWDQNSFSHKYNTWAGNLKSDDTIDIKSFKEWQEVKNEWEAFRKEIDNWYAGK